MWGSGALARNCPTPRDGDGGEGGSEGRRGVEWTSKMHFDSIESNHTDEL